MIVYENSVWGCGLKKVKKFKAVYSQVNLVLKHAIGSAACFSSSAPIQTPREANLGIDRFEIFDFFQDIEWMLRFARWS